MPATSLDLSDHSYLDSALSATLDSTDAFEGPEKLLEVWFYPSVSALPNAKGLRSISLDEWCSMLELVKCEVLSSKKTAHMDAFLLSESSMFVFEHKLTLKTCGTTTTLLCLPRLLAMVESHLGWVMKSPGSDKFHPYKVFYSRRCFMFPSKQHPIHRNWGDEVDYLNQFFLGGKSYVIGRSDQNDHWNLYITETNKTLASGLTSDERDETLEILMTGLDSGSARQFVADRTQSPSEEGLAACNAPGHVYGLEITKATGLDCVYDNQKSVPFVHDAFAFMPCGYSSNIIMDDKYYYTLHVTPEDGWSYASFESNVPVQDVSCGRQTQHDIVCRILDVFRPTDFCMTFFAKDLLSDRILQLMHLLDSLPNYVKRDKVIHELDEYQLIYLRYQRPAQ
ncbi:ABL061Cp [Eremothecium gossypii ATCC 10895]|uniref:S-adenosylmethionine decarboxylase proenzyme n=1 Tax=Eremothecium gossypii (strain ATCC 10895 / CBS 109.51 / FGSC 9923 / NRRL Y-1056) TaxID=284811 RepID=Q75E84_EREGS|nr:ABL061Cp [Eremothecium gossypii ATCC 10895]AAS50710.1 ABL061Cp [Eremothecium gossypii ATCC 10895]AEY94999.1 FABL061Cp [Eremothecium gossypii FDAG1]